MLQEVPVENGKAEPCEKSTRGFCPCKKWSGAQQKIKGVLVALSCESRRAKPMDTVDLIASKVRSVVYVAEKKAEIVRALGIDKALMKGGECR